MRLTLLHFNDVHGRLDQLPRLATLIQRARTAAAAAGAHVLLLDGGDSSDRAAWESDITKGRANFALLEAMGVQASVVGNGEALQWGRGALARLVTSVHFPVLVANLVDCADPARLAVPGLKGSHLLELDHFKIGLVGVTAVFRDGYARFGYTSTDPEPSVRREVEVLKAQGAKFIILLSHLGAPRTLEEKKTWKDPNEITDELVAAACPEIGVIVGGHSHTRLEAPLVVGDTLIVQAGDYGCCLGQLDLTIYPDSGRIAEYTYTLHSIEGVRSDPTIAATLELVREEAARVLDTPIGEASRDLPHFFDRPSPFAALVADALRDVSHADLAILFAGFAQRGLRAGPITRRDLYEALPGSAHATAAEVAGAQFRRMVERMLASPYRTQPFDPKRRAAPLGLPACSTNVQLDYDVTSSHLTGCLINRLPLDSSRRYRLASTFYTLNPVTDDPEYDFIGVEPSQVVENIQVEDVLWEIVGDWVKTKRSV